MSIDYEHRVTLFSMIGKFEYLENEYLKSGEEQIVLGPRVKRGSA